MRSSGDSNEVLDIFNAEAVNGRHCIRMANQVGPPGMII